MSASEKRSLGGRSWGEAALKLFYWQQIHRQLLNLNMKCTAISSNKRPSGVITGIITLGIVITWVQLDNRKFYYEDMHRSSSPGMKLDASSVTEFTPDWRCYSNIFYCVQHMLCVAFHAKPCIFLWNLSNSHGAARGCYNRGTDIEAFSLHS